MEQPTEKKEWTKPELIVLVRSKPEEAVLAACKLPPLIGLGPTNSEAACVSGMGCDLCDMPAPS
jgi:hypothetical protein